VRLLSGKWAKIRHSVSVRIKVRVHPGSSRNVVGGRYGEGVLVVRVTAPALDARPLDEGELTAVPAP
jgi:uncharacterized protein YggU (UPF0235/DUF167 family)